MAEKVNMLLAGILGVWFGGALVTLFGITSSMQLSEDAATALTPDKVLFGVVLWPVTIVRGFAALQTWAGREGALRMKEQADEIIASHEEAQHEDCDCLLCPQTCEDHESVVQQGLVELRGRVDEHAKNCPKCQEIEQWCKDQEAKQRH